MLLLYQISPISLFLLFICYCLLLIYFCLSVKSSCLSVKSLLNKGLK
uniref:ATP synthase membrane subunit 8 n=1 Tax=Trichuris sp. ETH392 TaxID=2856029 RepID=A0A8F5DPS0_9BILA|nr:ATP synthase membrane subunit 8 [Trichuris sp. ETH392]